MSKLHLHIKLCSARDPPLNKLASSHRQSAKKAVVGRGHGELERKRMHTTFSEPDPYKTELEILNATMKNAV